MLSYSTSVVITYTSGFAATASTASANALHAALQADWLPVRRPPPKLVSLGGLYRATMVTSAALIATLLPEAERSGMQELHLL